MILGLCQQPSMISIQNWDNVKEGIPYQNYLLRLSCYRWIRAIDESFVMGSKNESELVGMMLEDLHVQIVSNLLLQCLSFWKVTHTIRM